MRVIMHQIETGDLLIQGITKTANPLEMGFWFFTPGIWALTFTIVAIGLLVAGILNKKQEINHKKLFLFGAIVSLPLIFFNLSRFNNWIPFIITLIIILAVSYGICYLINKFTKYKILNDKLNLFIVTGQAFDGIASSIAIAFFGFSEQHVFSNMLINIHPALFASIKIILAILIAWSLDDYLKEEKNKLAKIHPKKLEAKKNLVEFIKLILAILGFATGLASLFKMGLI